jgi:hypothetical protein
MADSTVSHYRRLGRVTYSDRPTRRVLNRFGLLRSPRTRAASFSGDCEKQFHAPAGSNGDHQIRRFPITRRPYQRLYRPISGFCSLRVAYRRQAGSTGGGGGASEASLSVVGAERENTRPLQKRALPKPLLFRAPLLRRHRIAAAGSPSPAATPGAPTRRGVDAGGRTHAPCIVQSASAPTGSVIDGSRK